MNVREKFEEQEYKILSPLAAKSAESVRDQDERLCDFRTAYQRDRDRIIHAKSFRRLKHKTQVYIAPGDHYRMRMTHSLEVAQISRTIARGLRLNEDLVEAAALGHDVGHTPFGHAGEDALKNLIGHFRHNEQSLRVVEVLEREGRGLNLTIAVRDAILNHTGSGVPITLEGRIVKLADRIAYLCHDYDDGLRSGMLKVDDLPEIVQDVLGTRPSAMITAMVSDIILGSMDKTDIIVSPNIKMAMDEFRRFMFKKIYHSDHLADERRKAVFIIEQLYNHFLKEFTTMPPEFCSREERWGREVVVADYIAGLTDIFAVELFNKIFIPNIRVGV